jgi:hypothetical protein
MSRERNQENNPIHNSLKVKYLVIYLTKDMKYLYNETYKTSKF